MTAQAGSLATALFPMSALANNRKRVLIEAGKEGGKLRMSWPQASAETEFQAEVAEPGSIAVNCRCLARLVDPLWLQRLFAPKGDPRIELRGDLFGGSLSVKCDGETEYIKVAKDPGPFLGEGLDETGIAWLEGVSSERLRDAIEKTFGSAPRHPHGLVAAGLRNYPDGLGMAYFNWRRYSAVFEIHPAPLRGIGPNGITVLSSGLKRLLTLLCFSERVDLGLIKRGDGWGRLIAKARSWKLAMEAYVEWSWPDCRKIVPPDERLAAKASLDRKSLVRALRRLKQPRVTSVELSFSAGAGLSLVLNMFRSVSEERLPADVSGPPFSETFIAECLLGVLKPMRSPRVLIRALAEKPGCAIFTGEADRGYLGIVDCDRDDDEWDG